MTTTIIELPRRIRRNVIAALATAALLAPTALVISRINDNDPHRIATPDATPVQVAPPMERASAQEAAGEVCRGGLEWACAFTPQIEPTGTTSVAEAAGEVCRGGLEWACAFTPQLVSHN